MNTGATLPPDRRSAWQRLAYLLSRLEDGLLVCALIAMLLLAGGQIVLRDLFQTGLSWTDPLLRVMVLWTGMLGAMAATRDKNHISIDLVSRMLPGRSRVVSRLLTDLFTALVCGALAYFGYRLVLMDYDVQTLAFAWVPVWVCELILPLGFGSICLRFTFAVVAGLRSLWSGKG